MDAPLAMGLSIAGALVASAVAFPLVVAPLASFARVAIGRGSVGVGPKLFEARVGGVAWTVKLLPLSSYVVAEGMLGAALAGEDERAASADRARARGRLPWDEAPPVRRAIVFVVAPRLAALAIAAAVIGPARAITAVVRGVPAVLFLGASARAVLDAGAAVLAREGAPTFAALALCKILALGVVALPTDVVFATSHRADAWLARVRAAAMLATLALLAAWAVAWARWALA